jgi:hypothetical protein
MEIFTHPPYPPSQREGGDISEIGDLWVLRTHKSPISPIFSPLLGGRGQGWGDCGLVKVH